MDGQSQNIAHLKQLELLNDKQEGVNDPYHHESNQYGQKVGSEQGLDKHNGGAEHDGKQTLV